ncbi:MAG: hemagglutinin repeat-containing protein [Ramlibacter sp.]
MHLRTRAILNRLACRLSAADHELQRQLALPPDLSAPRHGLRRLARVFTAVFIAQTLLAGTPAHAQVTSAADAPAGQKPLIDAAANGTPIVLIAPPSKAGVSRNQYEQLNVGPKGLILNNSTGNAQTQIGGWIKGNLQLGLTPARIILNEVTGANASQLRGTIEVGGQKADLVIANPNGITCDGCGFLNSDRATLTTGTPRFGTDGAVSGFDVRQGVVQIGPDGLNATEQQQLELHARGLVIEGEVYSRNLQAVIGANQVVYGTLHALPQATAQDGTGEAPRFAVDIKALGGMYAGQIYLIATDKGLGVNSTGRAATLAGNLVLSANGDLTLKDTYSSGNAQLTSTGKTALTGQTVADGGVTIESAQQLTNSGAMQAPTLQLNAPALHNSGSIHQTAPGANLALALPGGLQNSGQIYTPGNLTVQAGAVSSSGASNTATGQLTAGGSLQIAATSLQLTGQQLAANGSITVQAQTLSATDGSMNAGGNVALDASGRLDVTGTTVSANGQTRLAGSEIALERARIAAVGNVQITSPGLVMANTADISSNANLSVQGSRVDVSAATMTAVVTASIKADGDIKLDGSQLAAGQRVELVGQGISTPGATVTADRITIDAGAGALTNLGGKILASSAEGDALTVNATGITNQGGELRANGGLTLDARGGVIDNTAGVIAGTTGALTHLGGLTNKGGILHTQSDLAITSTALDNSGGAIVTAGALTVSTPGQTINNTKGLMQAGGAVSLDSGGADLKNADGAVVSGTALTVNANTVDTAAGTLAAGTDMTVTAGHLRAGSAKLGSGGAMNITASGNADLGTAEMGAGGDLAIQAGTVQATGANVAGNANAQVTGGSITGGNWSAQGNLSATSAGVLNVAGGSLLAGGNLMAQGQGIITDGARVAGQEVTLDAGTGAVSNVGGQIHARGSLQVQASQLVNRGGTVSTGGALALRGAALENHAGTIQASGNLTIHTAGQALDNTAGKIISGGNTTVQAGALSNSGGTISAGGTAHVQAAALNTAQGQISGTRQLDILVTQRLAAVGATLGTQGKFTASAGEIDAQAATMTAGETLSATAAGGADVRGATVKSLQALSLQTGAALAADGAVIRSGETVQITGQGIGAGAAQIGAVGQVTLNAGAGDFTAPGVLVQSENASISLGAAAVNVAGHAAGGPSPTGLLAGHGIEVTATGAVDLSGAATHAAAGVTITAQGSITNNAGQIIAGNEASLSGAFLNNQGGMIDANGPIDVSVTTGQVNNDQGRISTRDVLTMSTPTGGAAGPLTRLTNAGGVIETAGALNAQLQNFNNEGGSVVALAGLAISGGPVNNTDGRLASQGNVSVDTQGGAFAGNNGKVISAQGNITLTAGATTLNNATVTSGGNTALSTTNLQASHVTLAAGGNATVTADQGIDVGGGSVSAQTISLDAGSGVLNNASGNLTARAATGTAMMLQSQGLANDGGTIASNAELSINAGAGSLSNAAGQILAVGAADIRSTGLNNVAGTTASNGNLTINAAQAHANAATDSTGGTIQSGQSITLAAGTTTLTNATVTSGGNTTLNTAELQASQARINALGDFSATATGAVTADRVTLAAGGSAVITAAQGMDVNRGSVSAQSINLDAGSGELNNAAGAILAVGAADIRSTGLYNVGGTIASNGNLTINAAQAHANAATDSTGGTLQSGQNITLTAGATTLTNATVTSGGNTTFNTAALQADQARINVQGNFSATSSAAVTAQQLALAAGGSAAITAAQGMDLSQASVSAQTITMNAGGVLNNTTGNLIASATTGTALTLQSQGLVNDQGTIASNAGLSINANAGSISNTAGRVLALGAADVRSTGLANVGGTIASNGDLTIDAAQAHANAATDSTGGTLQSGQNITLTAGSTTLTNATVTSGGNTTLNTGALQASQARINAGGNFTATSSGAVTADQVALATSGSAAIMAAQGIDVNRGTVSAQAINLDAGTGALNNNAGSILAVGTADIRSTGLYNVGGTIASNGNLTIHAAQANASAAADSTGGTLQSGQNITLTAGATTLADATVTSGDNTTLNTADRQASQARINVLGDFNATSTGAVTADRVALAAGGSAVITAAQGMDVNRGSVSAQTIGLDAGSGALNNNVGNILAVGAADIRSTGLYNVGGTIASNGNLTINAAQAHANAATDSTGGTLQSGQNITLTAGATTLTNATVTSGGNTTLNTAQLQANQARINALGNFSATSSAAVTAQQLALAAGDGATITATQGIDLSQGSVSAQTIALNAGGALNNTGGYLHAGATTGTALTSQSQGLVNDQGTITSKAGLSIQANTGSVSNAAGRILALGAADVGSTGLNNAAGTIASNGDLTLNTVQAHANAATDSTGGTLQSGQNIALTAGSTTLTNATVTSGGNTAFATGALQASQARINAQGNFTATSSAAVTADRLALAAGGNVAITATQGIDVNRGTVSAQTVNLNAGSGTLNNNAGSIQAVDALDIRSTGLNNRAGTIASNGDLTINAALANAIATLDSTDGAIRSAQAITLTAGATTLTNATVTSGGNMTLNTGDLQASQARINVGGNLTATASGALNNNAGSILVTGAADIRSTGLTNVDGNIASNGALTINAAQANAATETNNTRGTIRSAQASVMLTTGALDNTRADISAGNDVQVTAAGALTNDQACIVAGRDATVSASAIGNTSGLIAGNRNATLTAGAGGVTNTSGTIQGASDLAVTSAGDVANTSGQLLAGHQLALSSGALTNSQGQIGAQTGSVTLTVTSYTNTGGSVVAGGPLSLDTQGGALTANGSTFDSGADMTLRAGAAQLNDAAITSSGSINAQTTSLQANRANVQAAGNLTATAGAGAGAFNAANSTWQAGQTVALTGGAVAVADATVSANSTVAVTGASVDATRASITSPGDVSVVATSGALNITHASLLAGRDLTATGTGAGTTTGAQALAGRDLTLGNGTAFDFAAAGLQYQFGRDLTVRAQGISTAGQQVSARNLTLDAGSGPLNNQGGTLQATETLTASATGLNNQNGVIAANGAVTASAGTGTLNNAGGQIYSTQGATSVSGATIDNATGTVSAATDVSITGGTLNNTGNTIAAGRNLTATLSGAVNNAGGRLIANTGAASVTANGIDNQGGSISGATNTTADAGSGTLSNTGGLVTGQNVSIGGAVNNATGVISGSNAVSMTTRAIHNDGGVIESGEGGISINTQGHTLTNTNSGTTRGIVSQGNIAIAAGDINNQLGYIGANGSLNITQSSTIHNQGGTLLGLGGVSVTTGTLNNQGGSILGGVDVSVNAGTVNNASSGTIYAGRDLTVNAGSIDNGNTQNGSYTTGLLAGRNASITAATITNASGAIVALGDATVRASSSLNNTQGQISGNTVTIQTPSLTNTAGRADAQQRMTVQVPHFSADGVLASNGAMNLELQGNYVNTGVVSASGDLNISTTGSYTNLNRVSAQNSLSLTAAGIDNAAGATIDSQRTTLNAGGGTLNNAGLINSTAGQTSITAGTLNNTGRIYGDSIALNANVNNSAAAGAGAAIATRGGNVTINGALNNSDDALVLSLGSIQINGSARNDGSTINAMGNVTITGALTNTHVGLQTGSQTRTEPAHAVYITPSGSTTRYNVADLAWTGHTGGHWVLPSTTYPLGTFGADPKPAATWCGLDGNGGEGGNWVCGYNYGTSDPIWALMRVASPGAGPAFPGHCMDYGGESGNIQRNTTGVCADLWAGYDAHQASLANAYTQLDAAIAAFNNDLNNRTLIDWYETTITGTTITETTAVPGRAAKVLAGGNIHIGGGSNIDSVIVAGGSLNGGAMNNIASQGTRQTSATGYQVFSHRTWSGGFSSSYGRETSAPQPIADAPVTQTLTLPVLQYQSSGSPAAPGAGGNSSPVGGAAASVVGVGRSIGTARNADPTGTANAAVQTGTPSTETGAAVQVNTATTAQAQSAPAVNGVQAAGGDTVATGAGNTLTGNTPTGHTTVTTGTGAAPTAGGSVTAGANPTGNTTVTTGANPTGSTALTAAAGNNATAGTAVTPGTGTGTNTGGTVQAATGTNPNVVATTASLSAAPDAALPGSVIAAGVRAGQLAAITTSLTNFAAAAAIQPAQAQAVDTSTRRSAPATVKAAGYSTVRASGAVRAPGNQLFRINRNPRAPLVETDPAFTGYRTWISSAYMLQQLAIDPERNMKLYGDGFAEQRLIDDQILALTGRRFLSGYQRTEDQYHDLMDAGVMFAREYQLSPGVALSAEQMALLTTDIVWLEAKEVTLPDGSTMTALVPTVYLRRPTTGDLTPEGALIAGSNVTLRSPGDLTNSGTIIANGDAAKGDGKLTVTGNNVNNSGTLAGNQITITADNTLNNAGGVVQGLGTGSTASLNARDIILRTTTQSSTASIEGPNGTSTGTRTNADRIATVSADSVKLAALNNITLAGATVQAANDLTMTAGGALISEAVATGYMLNTPLGGSHSGRTGYISEAATTQQLTTLAGNNVAITATGDAAFKGTNINAVNDLTITGKTVTIDAVKESLSRDQQGIGKKGYERVAKADETLAGANLSAGNNATITATGGNITGTGAAITATRSAATLTASGDVSLNAATTQHSTLAESFNASKGFLSSKSSLRESDSTATLAEGSSLSGKTVAVVGGRDVNIHGSSVVSDTQTTISAARNVSITAAMETLTSNSFVEEKKSGLGAMGGISYGKREQSTDTDTTATRAAASNIASLKGNVSISAGQTYNQVGSNVMTPVGNVDITAKTVNITEARETSTSETEQKFKQSGISVNATGAIATAIHTMDSLAEQAGKAKDGRMQGLAVLAGAVEAKKALDAIEALAKDPANAGSIGISISLGSQKNQSNAQSQSNTAAGSTVAAGGNVTITAQGAGDNSNVTVQGSNISAANTASLKADGQVNLLAAQNTSEQHSQNSGSSASIGVGITFGDKTGISFNASASTSKGKSDGSDLTHTNTQVNGGKVVNIQSGGDTTLKGAVVSANTVNANVGGNLKIESLQDTAKFDEKQTNAGFGVTLCIPPLCVGSSSATVSAGKTTINSNYQSVGEQSGIKAGDGGFNVNVLGATDLKGGVISSTDKAHNDGKNSFASAGGVTLSDIQNSADYNAKGVSITAGYSSAPQDGDGNPVKDNNGNVIGGKPIGGGGIGSDKGSATSTTQAGITGIAGNTAARTGDAETGIKPIFDANAVRDGINAQVSITATALPVVAKGWADFANEQQNKATTAQDKACWAEGGACRVAGHMAIGALAGGATGAAGAGASQAIVPTIGDALRDTNLPDAVKQVIVAGLGVAIGAAAGGTAGAVTGGNATVNNYLTQAQWKAMADERARCADQACRDGVDTRYGALSASQDEALRQACTNLNSATCRTLVTAAVDGSATQLELVAKGKLPDNYLGGRDFNSNVNLFAQKMQAQDVVNACATNPAQCDQARLAGSVRLLMTATVVAASAAAVTVLGAEAAALAAFARNPVLYCTQSPTGCMAGVELALCAAAGPACPPGTLVPTASQLATVKQVVADAEAAAAGRVAGGVGGGSSAAGGMRTTGAAGSSGVLISEQI